jgi:hypothetical protein
MYDDSSDEYEEGADAAEDGKKIIDCPYPSGSEQYDDWVDGFLEYGG